MTSATIRSISGGQDLHGTAAPIDQRAVRDVCPHAGKDFVLTIQGKVIVELGDKDMGQGSRTRHAARNQDACRSASYDIKSLRLTSKGSPQMNDFNLDTLSLKELKSLQKDVAKAIDTHGGRQKSEARAKVEEFARSLGYHLADLLVVDGVKNTRAPAAAKYRNPENAEVTWSGRGRKPVWFSEAIVAGKSPEDLAV